VAPAASHTATLEKYRRAQTGPVFGGHTLDLGDQTAWVIGVIDISHSNPVTLKLVME
jgi:hypothetical protein